MDLNGYDQAVTNRETQSIIIDMTKEELQSLAEDKWAQGTFSSPRRSMLRHFLKWGHGLDLKAYIAAAEAVIESALPFEKADAWGRKCTRYVSGTRHVTCDHSGKILTYYDTSKAPGGGIGA